jgi:hypothetical protein
MNSDKIYKLCYAFKAAMEKRSDVTSDLATRIMHSLVPTSGHPEEDRQKLTHLVSTHLIGVADRYVDRAINIIMDELKYSLDEDISEFAEEKYTKDDYEKILYLAIKSFDNLEIWKEKFGGNKWTNFTEKVLELYKSIQKFRKAKEEKDRKTMNEQAGMISVYLNVLDGMTHNTDSFLNRMIESEDNYGDDDDDDDDEDYFFNEDFKNKMKEVTNLMDSKELHSKQDVIPFIRKRIYENPDSYLYREYLRDIYKNEERSDPEDLKFEMEKIRNKKIIINYISTSIDDLISSIEKGIKQGKTIKDNYGVQNYEYHLNKIVNYPRIRSMKGDLEQIAFNNDTSTMEGMLKVVKQIKEFILNNI